MSFWKARKVLITGGAGFIGSHLARRLVAEGAKVRIADNLERGCIENLDSVLSEVDFREADMRDQDICLSVCQDMDAIFHLASKVGGINYYLSKPAEVMSQNLLIDASVLQAALICQVPYYLYASSAHVYPTGLQLKPDAPPITEEQALPAHPELSYGWAKLLGERLIEYALEEGHQLKAAIMRIIGAFGPNQDLDLATASAIPAFIRRAIEYPARQPFKILGSGQETRSYCYISDVVDGLLQATEKLENCQLVGPMNLGSEHRIKIIDLANEIIDISGKKIEIEHDLSHPTTIWGQVLDCSYARELLDWQPQIPLRTGLERTYSYVLERLNSGPK